MVGDFFFVFFLKRERERVGRVGEKEEEEEQ